MLVLCPGCLPACTEHLSSGLASRNLHLLRPKALFKLKPTLLVQEITAADSLLDIKPFLLFLNWQENGG